MLSSMCIHVTVEGFGDDNATAVIVEGFGDDNATAYGLLLL